MLVRMVLLAASILLPACSGDSERSSLPESSMQPDQFLAENAAREEVSVTESGLLYEVLRAADGPKPNRESIVTVHYIGTLTDGTEFDNSYLRGEPATFPLTGAIDGWVEGVQLMNVGSQYRFVMPAHLAYGGAGAGTLIGPDATLVFEIELLEINSN